jgi:uncharacterized membrane protein
MARVSAFDRLRGLIIVLMAIDHASYFIARVHPLETWATPPPYYADTAEFLTRWLTHLCAPGFFMLMGIGIVYLAESRVAAGWSAGRITRFLATRGAVLLVVQHLIENPAWLLGTISANPLVEASLPSLPGAGGEIMLSFGVLSALGVAMIVGSVLWRAPQGVLVVGAVVVLLAGGAMVPASSAIMDPQPVWKQLLFVPGRTGILQNLYPWVVWLFPMVCGLSLGRAFSREPRSAASSSALLGMGLLISFVLVRLLGGDPYPPTGGLIGFLTVTKYPPSEAFFFLMLGLNPAVAVRTGEVARALALAVGGLRPRTVLLLPRALVAAGRAQLAVPDGHVVPGDVSRLGPRRSGVVSDVRLVRPLQVVDAPGIVLAPFLKK